MTIFAGVFYRDRGPVQAAHVQNLSRALSRHPEDMPVVIERPGLAIAMVNLGLLGPAALVDAGDAAVLAGEPFVTNTPQTPRQQDLETLLKAAKINDASPFQSTRGQYASALYDLEAHKLTLVSDRIGVRPLYWADLGSVVVFATALRIFNALDWVPKTLNHGALHEAVSMGFWLEDATPYHHVRMLPGGRRLVFDAAGRTEIEDWSWSAIPDDRPVTDQAVDELYQHFQDAVSLRLKSDTKARAMLSGGLDSRAIVTELHRRQCGLQAMTFTWPRALDAAIAEDYAKALGISHHQRSVPRPIPHPTPYYIAEALRTPSPFRDLDGATANLVWAGDGGSVCLGYVNTNADVSELLRQRKFSEAAVKYLHRKFSLLPKALLAAGEYADYKDHLQRRMTEIFSSFPGRDPARAVQWYLMTNQERHQVISLYENMDIWRFDYLMPLFDSELVAAFQRFPLDECMGHKLYDRWLDRFPQVIRSVPWQAYPGHVASPLPLPDADQQWQPLSKDYKRQVRRNALTRYASVRNEGAKRPDFIEPFREAAAVWLTRFGVNNFAYLVEAAATYRAWAAGRSDL